MSPGTRSFIAIGFTVAAYLGPVVQPSYAQQLKIENAFPRQLPIGQTTVINVVVATRDDIQAAEILPSQGVTVSSITRGETFQGALTWSTIAVDVAKDAKPGERALVLQLPAGRTIPMSLTIPSHVPRISDLRILDIRSNPPALDLQVAGADASADLGTTPHVWFMVACGDMPLPGVVRGSAARQGEGGVIRATVPRPAVEPGARAVAKCDVQVRVADSVGFESNTLRTTLDVPNQSGARP
ncbi:MAG TPA: hypothetical protein VIK60_04900 [Vicinamibacterales bacterium]